jgi:hypothetical protein
MQQGRAGGGHLGIVVGTSSADEQMRSAEPPRSPVHPNLRPPGMYLYPPVSSAGTAALRRMADARMATARAEVSQSDMCHRCVGRRVAILTRVKRPHSHARRHQTDSSE